jgi:hypothetical protein
MMPPPLITLFPTIFVTTLAFIFNIGIQTSHGSSNTTMGLSMPNVTVPEINYSYENENENTNTNTQAQNCQMPPCPPGEMCIQVCPETVP